MKLFCDALASAAVQFKHTHEVHVYDYEQPIVCTCVCVGVSAINQMNLHLRNTFQCPSAIRSPKHQIKHTHGWPGHGWLHVLMACKVKSEKRKILITIYRCGTNAKGMLIFQFTTVGQPFFLIFNHFRRESATSMESHARIDTSRHGWRCVAVE